MMFIFTVGAFCDADPVPSHWGSHNPNCQTIDGRMLFLLCWLSSAPAQPQPSYRWPPTYAAAIRHYMPLLQPYFDHYLLYTVEEDRCSWPPSGTDHLA